MLRFMMVDETTLPGKWAESRIVRRIAQDARTPGEYVYRFSGRVSTSKIRRIVEAFNDRFVRDVFGATSASVDIRHDDGDVPYEVIEVRSLMGPHRFESAVAPVQLEHGSW